MKELKFEDDNPAEKYVLTQDWNHPDGQIFVSEKQVQFIAKSKEEGKDMVNIGENGRMKIIRINDIKRIDIAGNWRSAEQKKEAAKAKYVYDLHWGFINATRGNSPDKDMTFETYLERLGKNKETIEKIKKQLAKSGVNPTEL